MEELVVRLQYGGTGSEVTIWRDWKCGKIWKNRLWG